MTQQAAYCSLIPNTSPTGTPQAAWPKRTNPPTLPHTENLKKNSASTFIGRLLCIDWVAPHGPWDDLLVFIFDGGTLTDQQIAVLKPLDNELATFEFCTLEQAAQRLRPYVWHRTQTALQTLTTGTVEYLQNGRVSQ